MRFAKPKPETVRTCQAIIAGAFTPAAAVFLLYAAWCAFTWRNFHFLDYGGYTNMLWNTAHGAPFRVLLDRSYLEFHLSFSLALAAPLFRIWDHPFLPALLQWLAILGGTLILLRAMLRRGAGLEEGLALTFFFVAYPLTQSAALAEFHGVALYFLLVPWLWLALGGPECRRPPPGAWIPLCLILGTREDAFLVVLGMLTYLALRRRSPLIGAMAVLALAYGLLAVFVLFPLINGVSLFAFRAGWFAGAVDSAGDGWSAVTVRLGSLLWVVLPALPLLRRRGWIAVAAFTGVPLIAALASASPHQYGLRLHYSASVMACLAPALAEAAALQRSAVTGNRCVPAKSVWAIFLVMLTFCAHIYGGLVPAGGRHDRVYGSLHPDGLRLLQAARQIPGRGVLICREQLSPFCANRADLLVWELLDPSRHDFDLVFATVDELRGGRGDLIRDLLSRGEYGVRYFDGLSFILQRGYDTGRNRELMGR